MKLWLKLYSLGQRLYGQDARYELKQQEERLPQYPHFVCVSDRKQHVYSQSKASSDLHGHILHVRRAKADPNSLCCNVIHELLVNQPRTSQPHHLDM